MWYCPEGALFPDSAWNSGTRYSTVNTLWDFDDFSPHHVYFTENIFVNLTEKGGYTDIPRLLSNPGDWVVVNDGTYYDLGNDSHVAGTHPGRFSSWGLGGLSRGRNGPGAPRGVNAGTVDGAVIWAPQGECVLGYATCGSVNNYALCHQLEPPLPRRPGRYAVARTITSD